MEQTPDQASPGLHNTWTEALLGAARQSGPPLHYLISAEKRTYNGEVQSVVQKTANVSIRTGQRESAALSESVLFTHSPKPRRLHKRSSVVTAWTGTGNRYAPGFASATRFLRE